MSTQVTDQQATNTSTLHNINNNPILLGVLLLLMNIGSKYIMLDLPDSIDILFKSVFSRALVVFAILFISTRDIVVSTLITLMFYLIMKYLINPKSKSCILPNKNQYLNIFENKEIPKEVYEKARKVVEIFEKQQIKSVKMNQNLS